MTRHSSAYPLIIRDAMGGAALFFISLFIFQAPAKVANWGLFLLAIYICFPVGFLMIVVAIEVILSSAGDSFLIIETFQTGFIWQRLGRSKVVFWDEIKWILNNGCHSHHGGIDSRWFFSFHIRLVNGRSLSFGPYVNGCYDLARAIEEESASFLLGRILAEYRAGNLVDFGRIKVSEIGWFKYGSFLPWEKVSSVRIEDRGWFCVACDERPVRLWHGTSLNKIRNFHVMRNCLREIGWRI